MEILFNVGAISVIFNMYSVRSIRIQYCTYEYIKYPYSTRLLVRKIYNTTYTHTSMYS